MPRAACACCTQSTPLSPRSLEMFTLLHRREMLTSCTSYTYYVHVLIRAELLSYCLRMKSFSSHSPAEGTAALPESPSSLSHAFAFTSSFILWSETELNEHIHEERLASPQTTDGLHQHRQPMHPFSFQPRLEKVQLKPNCCFFLFRSESKSGDVLAPTRSAH